MEVLKPFDTENYGWRLHIFKKSLWISCHFDTLRLDIVKKCLQISSHCDTQRLHIVKKSLWISSHFGKENHRWRLDIVFL